MTYKGHYEKGVVVLDEPAPLTDGTPVDIAVSDVMPAEGQPRGSHFEHYRAFIGAIKDSPEDWSRNHDHYLREEYRS